MAARHQFPGMRWLLWRRAASLRTGMLAGIYASSLFVAWLIVAIRFPAPEPFAAGINIVAGIIVLLVLGIPVLRFRTAPGRLFVAGMVAWTILTATYLVSEMHFTLLGSSLGALHIFMLGAVSYGFLAVCDWVIVMCAGVRRQHMLQSAGRMPSAGRRHTN